MKYFLKKTVLLALSKDVPKHFPHAQSFARTFALYGANLGSITNIIYSYIY